MGPAFPSGASSLLLWGEVKDPDVDIENLNDWWTNEHLPERLSIPGFQRARRYHAVDENHPSHHRYLTVYDVDSLATLTSDAYMEKLNNPTAGTKKYLPLLATMNRAACIGLYAWSREEISVCKGVLGGHVSLLETKIFPEDDAIANMTERARTLCGSLSRSHRSIISCCLSLENAAATAPGSQSRSYQDVQLSADNGGKDQARLLLLIESTESMKRSSEELVELLADAQGETKHVRRQEYELMCCLRK